MASSAVAAVAETTTHPRRVAATGGQIIVKDTCFSADGTTLITLGTDRRICSTILPLDLDEKPAEPRALPSHVAVTHSDPVSAFASFPGFNLQEPSRTIVLSAAADLPIQLHNSVYPSDQQRSLASYPLVDPGTERYIQSGSLAFSSDGSFFIAGSLRQLSIFDPTRNGEGPVETYHSRTARAMRTQRFSTRGTSWQSDKCRGRYRALAIHGSHSLLAAGTDMGHVGIYGNEGKGDHMTHLALADNRDAADRIGGAGVASLAWSPCGRYLCIAETKSNGVQVFDVRTTVRPVAFLTGRKALAPYKMNIAVTQTSHGYQLLCGGTDGFVRVWNNPGCIQNEHNADAEFQADQDAITSVATHPGGSFLATCSGDLTFDGHSSGPISDDGPEPAPTGTGHSLNLWNVVQYCPRSDPGDSQVSQHASLHQTPIETALRPA